uniref:Calcium/calmodulin dependent protein kinase IV n=1 Tax=Molossus molossus TaxID=27622 RepID=A0A7J8IXQ6_MOLMO|nr:calcium/calmodulin dependent protein kinase IV [Molossus molossus]
MLKVTVPSCSASSCSSVTASVAPGAGSLVPDYWIDGSNRDALNDFFEVESELGRGATSIVYRCKQKGTQKPYALKVLKKTVDKKIVRTEIGVLLRLSHPNIVSVFLTTILDNLQSYRMGFFFFFFFFYCPH